MQSKLARNDSILCAIESLLETYSRIKTDSRSSSGSTVPPGRNEIDFGAHHSVSILLCFRITVLTDPALYLVPLITALS